MCCQILCWRSLWHIVVCGQVEAEEPENECEGFTLFKCKQRISRNQFMWGTVPNILKTINKYILLSPYPFPSLPGIWVSQKI